MSNDEPSDWTGKIRLSPQQLNEIFEDKLIHLQPVMENALHEMERASAAFSRQDESWRELFARARLAVA